ncbi:hypothetical protein SKAU_G00416350 [Synaphobranchus kaupii]|uniref:Murine leukemia virus integrase C-terminal domain-containing protein n=1 Tax=Synaphobranchus kaupii TaxID=118154 RepID=A0A9Q1E7H4_SYNKA|nr:hypothetical protein SKAU_G00416350 [Synaphobranchus kaupii]
MAEYPEMFYYAWDLDRCPVTAKAIQMARNEWTGDSQVGYAVVTHHQVLESARLPGHLSAQAAELFALTRACHLAEGQPDAISQGNATADTAAKAAAFPPPNTILSLLTQAAAPTDTPLASVQDCKAGATPQEKAKWKRDGMKVPNAAHPAPQQPFEYLMMDFIELNPCRGLVLDKELADTRMISYCVQLSNVLRSVHQQVKAALPEPASGPLHDLQPGDWVVIKDFRRKKWHQARWRGPFQVLLTMPTAVRVEGRASWVHASHCERAPPAPKEG